MIVKSSVISNYCLLLKSHGILDKTGKKLSINDLLFYRAVLVWYNLKHSIQSPTPH